MAFAPRLFRRPFRVLLGRMLSYRNALFAFWAAAACKF